MKDLQLTSSNLSFITQELAKLDLTKPKRVSVSEWKEKRGLSMNAQQHLFYGQIAKHYGDRNALDVKNFCKHTFGLPILLMSATYADKLEFLLHKLDYYKHGYDSKMKLIQCLST